MSRLPRVFTFLCLLVACLPTTALADEGKDLTLYFRAAITIEPDGSLSKLEWNDGDRIPAVLRARLDERVRSWQFVPGQLDGTAAQTETTLRLRLLARPDGEALVVTVESAETGATLGRLEPPQYPREALRRGVEAAVLADLAVTPDGAREVAIAGFQGHEGARKKFERAVVRMFDHVEVQFELVGGQPAPAQFSVPVDFCLNSCPERRWPERTANASPATAPGEPMPQGSVARLATSVRGTAI